MQSETPKQNKNKNKRKNFFVLKTKIEPVGTKQIVPNHQNNEYYNEEPAESD